MLWLLLPLAVCVQANATPSLFGSWVADTIGLPAFRLSTAANNLTMQAGLVHQVGNDVVDLLVAADGLVSLRQDEGGPKLLSAYNPAVFQFRGGAGFVFADGAAFPSAASVCVDKLTCTMDRLLGVGHVVKQSTNATSGASVTHDITTPFGRYPFAVSAVNVTSPGQGAYGEVWGALPYELVAEEYLSDSQSPQHWAHAHTLVCLDGDGKPLPPSTNSTCPPSAAVAGLLDTRTVPNARGGASHHDEFPRRVFTVVVFPPGSVSLSTDAAAVYAGGEAAPAFGRSLDGNLSVTGATSTHALRVAVNDGATQVTIVHGYLPGDDETVGGVLADVLAAKSPQGVTEWLQSLAGAWKVEGIRLDIGDAEFSREQVWQAGYLRGALTFDSYFEEPVLNQNGVYQYHSGFQGAARDPLNHVLPFVFAFDATGNGSRDTSANVRSAVRYTLKSAWKGWRIPWGLQGFGLPYDSATSVNGNFFPSDLELWVMGTVARYTTATRDLSLMKEVIVNNATGDSISVSDAVWALFGHLVNVTGVGEHGLLRQLNSDHNDGFYSNIGLTETNSTAYKYALQHAETVMNSGMGVYFARAGAAAYRMVGEHARSDTLLDWANTMTLALNSHALNTNAAYYRRTFLGTASAGWVGGDGTVPGIYAADHALWLEPNSWIVLAGVPDAAPPFAVNSSVAPPPGVGNRTHAIVAAMDAALRQPVPIGAAFANQSYQRYSGKGAYSDSWYCGNMVLVHALGVRGYNDLAVEEVLKNSFNAHVAAYPEVFEGTTTGSDSYVTLFRTGAPQGTGGVADWPLLNTWAHAVSQWMLPLAFGVEADDRGLNVSLRLSHPDEFVLNSTLLTILRSTTACNPGDTACYVVAWRPVPGEPPVLTAALRDGEAHRLSSTTCSGSPVSPTVAPASGAVVLPCPPSAAAYVWTLGIK